MKLVIDCNVLISAGLTDGLCREVLKGASQKGEIYLSRDIVLEYLLVSRRNKFKAHQPYLEKLIELIVQVAEVIDPMPSIFQLPDPNDKKYIDLAISVPATYLITGNLVDFPEKKYGSTVILSPRNFADHILKKESINVA
jgi:uncharacterized protein